MKLQDKYYSTSVSTLGTSFEKINNISVWLPLVKHLSFESAMYSIPKSILTNSRYLFIKKKIISTNQIMINLKKYENKMP